MTMKRNSKAIIQPVLKIAMSGTVASLVPASLAVGEMFNHAHPIMLKCTSSPDMFLYLSTNSEKEDWYIALKSVAKNALQADEPSWNDFVSLLQTNPPVIPATTKPLPAMAGDPTTQWINALIGRVFLSSSTSHALVQAVEKRIQEKLAKAKRPAILGPISVRRLSLGQNPPLIYHAKLLRATSSGETVSLVYLKVKYRK
jgi:hypothetical protein